jgi:2,4'-dihydroxyacetophenone dioxygenase
MSTLHEQVETEYVGGDELPWVPFAPYSDEVHMKYFRIDPVRGEILVSMRFPGGLRLPPHYHTGTVIAHTLRGAWTYVEHDWVSKAGDTVFESAGSLHTPESVGEEEAEVFFVVVGELLFMDEQGNIVARENWQSSLARYAAYCREHGLEIKDLTAAH